jgi:hypothetical protein
MIPEKVLDLALEKLQRVKDKKGSPEEIAAYLICNGVFLAATLGISLRMIVRQVERAYEGAKTLVKDQN